MAMSRQIPASDRVAGARSSDRALRFKLRTLAKDLEMQVPAFGDGGVPLLRNHLATGRSRKYSLSNLTLFLTAVKRSVLGVVEPVARATTR